MNRAPRCHALAAHDLPAALTDVDLVVTRLVGDPDAVFHGWEADTRHLDPPLDDGLDGVDAVVEGDATALSDPRDERCRSAAHEDARRAVVGVENPVGHGRGKHAVVRCDA